MSNANTKLTGTSGPLSSKKKKIGKRILSEEGKKTREDWFNSLGPHEKGFPSRVAREMGLALIQKHDPWYSTANLYSFCTSRCTSRTHGSLANSSEGHRSPVSPTSPTSSISAGTPLIRRIQLDKWELVTTPNKETRIPESGTVKSGTAAVTSPDISVASSAQNEPVYSQGSLTPLSNTEGSQRISPEPRQYGTTTIHPVSVGRLSYIELSSTGRPSDEIIKSIQQVKKEVVENVSAPEESSDVASTWDETIEDVLRKKRKLDEEPEETTLESRTSNQDVPMGVEGSDSHTNEEVVTSTSRQTEGEDIDQKRYKAILLGIVFMQRLAKLATIGKGESNPDVVEPEEPKPNEDTMQI